MSKRRSNGEGALRLRADGRWELTYMVGFQPDGKRKYKSFYGKTQATVKMKAKEYWESNIDVLAVDKHQTFSAWSDIWFEGRKDAITPTTQESYRFTLRVLKTEFDNRRITDIKPYDIEIFLKHLQSEGYSYSFISKCRGMLFQIFAKAEANSFLLCSLNR